MVAVIDYNTGNLRSVCNALCRIGADFEVTSSPEKIRRASHVIMPGVGEASWAMRQLSILGLDTLVPRLTQPVLGICIGMQLMCGHSEEGDVDCLGIFPAQVRRLHPDMARGLKVPHMGWNCLEGVAAHPLLCGVRQDDMVYFVHSYAADPSPQTIAYGCHGREFSAAVARDNFCGTQFHPEKSGDVGERILRNFINIGK